MDRRTFCKTLVGAVPAGLVASTCKAETTPEPERRFTVYKLGSEERIAKQSEIQLAQETIAAFAHYNGRGPTGQELSDRLELPVVREDVVKRQGELMVVKIGTDDRPATSLDISDFQQQLAEVSKEPGLVIITHHAIEFLILHANPAETTFVVVSQTTHPDIIPVPTPTLV